VFNTVHACWWFLVLLGGPRKTGTLTDKREDFLYDREVRNEEDKAFNVWDKELDKMEKQQAKEKADFLRETEARSREQAQRREQEARERELQKLEEEREKAQQQAHVPKVERIEKEKESITQQSAQDKYEEQVASNPNNLQAFADLERVYKNEITFAKLSDGAIKNIVKYFGLGPRLNIGSKDAKGVKLGKLDKLLAKDMKSMLAYKRKFIGGAGAVGRGKSDDNSGGLYGDQIDKIMDVHKQFIGTVAVDELPTLVPYVHKDAPIGFVINLDKHNQKGSHWCAIYIDPVHSKSVEWFNSYGEAPPLDVLKGLKAIVAKINPNYFLKMKINRVIQQNNTSSNCGYFAMHFLLERMRGKSFSAATGFDDELKHNMAAKNEKEIERLKNMSPFNLLNHKDG
jgi:hypothetical protein